MFGSNDSEAMSPEDKSEKVDTEFERSLHELRRLADFYQSRGYHEKARDISDRLNRILFGGNDRIRGNERSRKAGANREDLDRSEDAS